MHFSWGFPCLWYSAAADGYHALGGWKNPLEVQLSWWKLSKADTLQHYIDHSFLIHLESYSRLLLMVLNTFYYAQWELYLLHRWPSYVEKTETQFWLNRKLSLGYWQDNRALERLKLYMHVLQKQHWTNTQDQHLYFRRGVIRDHLFPDTDTKGPLHIAVQSSLKSWISLPLTTS